MMLFVIIIIVELHNRVKKLGNCGPILIQVFKCWAFYLVETFDKNSLEIQSEWIKYIIKGEFIINN